MASSAAITLFPLVLPKKSWATAFFCCEIIVGHGFFSVINLKQTLALILKGSRTLIKVNAFPFPCCVTVLLFLIGTVEISCIIRY